jgi:hypothetical protein
VSDDIGAVLEAPELAPPLSAADPEALGVLELPDVEPVVEPEALPLMPPLAPGAELELLLEPPDAGGVTVTEPLVLELAGGVAAPGAELELLLELAGAREVSGAVLEPALDDEEVPGRVASLDFGADDGPRSQPVAASAIATAAATSVRWVSLCITVSFGWGGRYTAPGRHDGSVARDIVLRDLFRP